MAIGIFYIFYIVVLSIIGLFTYIIYRVKKIKIISLDGNIGAGKSTLLKNLKKYIDSHNIQNISILYEPVHIWEETGILNAFYNNKERYAGGFQYFVLNTLINSLNDEINKYTNSNHIIITERSLESTRWVFAQMLYDDQFINKIEMNNYLHLYSKINAKYFPTATIYLDVVPKICEERIIKRDRSGESNISIKYLERCNQYYNNMNISSLNPIFKINGNINLENQIIDGLCKSIIYFIQNN